MPSPLTIGEAKKAFKAFDTDGDGKLTKDELKEALTRPGGGKPLSDDEVEKFISKFDADGDGSLQITEFIKAWVKEGIFDIKGRDKAAVDEAAAAEEPAAAEKKPAAHPFGDDDDIADQIDECRRLLVDALDLGHELGAPLVRALRARVGAAEDEREREEEELRRARHRSGTPDDGRSRRGNGPQFLRLQP